MARERIELNGHDESFLFEGGSVPSLARAKTPVSPGRSRSNGSAESLSFDLREARTQVAGREDPASRTIDLGDDEDEAQFLRTQKRVPVRRGPIPKKAASWIRTALRMAATWIALAGLSYAAYDYGTHAPRFHINSSDNIEVTGVSNASRAQVMEVARHDVIARNVFSVSLDDRRKELEQIPWVESATVMRLLPNRIVISITERKPVAFVQIGSKIHLIDAGGVVIGLPANRQTRYSFPVIHGIADADPLSSRAAVMKIYNRFARELSSGEEGAQFMRQVSEVDLSDPEDVKATVNDLGGTVVIHLGASDFLERYKLFAAHIGEWRKQYKDVESVDLRWEGQIVVNQDTPHVQPAPPPLPTAVDPAGKPAAKPGGVRHRAKARRRRPTKKN